MTPGDQADTSGPAPGTAPGAAATTEFDGDWLLACSPIEGDDDYQVNTLTIAGDAARQRLFRYADAACTQLQQAEAFGAFDTEHDLVLRVGGALYGGDDDADPRLDGTTPERRYVALGPEPLVLQ